VLIVPGPGSPRHLPELAQMLGDDRARQLAAALSSEAEQWAGEVAPGRVYGLDAVGESLTDATARLLAEHHGPLLVVWPLLAHLRREHGSAALSDLAAGAELVIGPLVDGGLYLLGLIRPLADGVSLADNAWSGPDAMPAVLRSAAESGQELGILRAERALRRPADVHAALADPLTPEAIARILRG
jgi:glycosyltransferase A (GT-A) superfamily protein (DUF2064 family)